jgi:hypothetical protein
LGVNTPAIDIAATCSILKTEIMAIVKDMATIETTKAFRPTLAILKTRSLSLFCFERLQKTKEIKETTTSRTSCKKPQQS